MRIPHLKHMISLSRRVTEADLNGTVRRAIVGPQPLRPPPQAPPLTTPIALRQIRSYDDKTKRYTVHMASGAIERNIKFSEMKVVYHLTK